MNGWVGWTCSRGQWYSFHLWPSLEIDYIVRNKSLHFNLKWLIAEAKLNIFFRRVQRAV